MGKVLPSQRLLKQFEERLVFGDMNLSEIVRSGAQMMLQYALEREVTEALGRGYYENAPETTKEKGRRNGYESHRVLTGEGAVTVQVPQIRETSTGFRSKILDAYVSRTEKLDELIARMYVHGMSTRDIEATFADVLSGTGVSKSVVSRVTQCLSDDFEVFRKRDLSSEELLYLELDGTFLRYHQGAEKKEPILVATGYRIDGTRVLLHIGVGNGESYANWKGFLQEMVARGLREPLLIVTDGNPGVLKAIEEVFPQSLKQRCQKHRLENILGKAPKEIHDELKAEILESFHAKSYEQGLKKQQDVSLEQSDDIVTQQLSDLHHELTQAQSKLAAAEARYVSLRQSDPASASRSVQQSDDSGAASGARETVEAVRGARGEVSAGLAGDESGSNVRSKRSTTVWLSRRRGWPRSCARPRAPPSGKHRIGSVCSRRL